MRNFYLLLIIFLPSIVQAQLKQIAFAELTAGSGMYFGAEMSPTTITVTVQGPADRFIAFGFGTGMASGNDAIIWSTLGSGAAPLQLRDHRMAGSGVEPTVDAQQDWTVISNDVVGANRTIVASRALSTGDANDVTFNFAATTQNLFWAKGPSATNQLQYHGSSNRASGIVRTWVTVDQTPPTLTSTNPADNASGVSLTQNLTMNFSESISFGTGSFYLYDSNDNLIQQVSNGSSGLNILSNSVIWNPTANLVINTSYYVKIDATAVKDAANNFYAGIADETTWNFNTNDIVAPTLVASPFSPADNAVGVSLTQNLSVTFNEAVQLGTGNIELYDNTNTIVEAFDVSTSPLVTIAGNTVQINPSNDFTLNNQYYVHIPSGAIQDVSGNNYAGFTNNTTWNWNTNDLVAPTAVSPFTPADNSINVTVNPSFAISFSEDVQLNPTGTLTVFDAPGNPIEVFNAASANILVTGSNLTFTLTGPLNGSTLHYVQITNDFISDLSGNDFAGITDETTWDFTTGDFTNPVISTLLPLDNATTVAVNINPTIEFSETVTMGAGSFHLVNETTQQIESFNSGGGNVTENGTSFTLIPAVDLDENTQYHILIDNNAVFDQNGNNYDGLTDTTAWNFVTEDGSGIADLNIEEILSWNGEQLVIKVPFEKAEIVDMNGKRIRRIDSKETNLNNLVEGVYFICVSPKNQNPVVFRIYVD
jgi:methionine-rich copper-binding protein CopC